MKQRWVVGLATMALLASLFACSNSASGPSVSDRATGLAQTAAAVLTGTAAASITPVTPTPPPTVTPAVTAVPPATGTPPAPPTDTAVPPTVTSAPCNNNKADFVADINVPDGTHFAAGTAFQKTWALKNSGDCAWTTAYTLRNVGGEVMSGVTINMPNAVPPGATINLTVSFIAPTAAGDHTSHWQMFTPDGQAFGTKPYVTIKVP